MTIECCFELYCTVGRWYFSRHKGTEGNTFENVLPSVGNFTQAAPLPFPGTEFENFREPHSVPVAPVYWSCREANNAEEKGTTFRMCFLFWIKSLVYYFHLISNDGTSTSDS